ncbi:hypothetical protein DVH24_039811 [Malus domestica]|uniref:Uncharacterized protein n=1 Tax=Malus domestica TaxID=3750 RepID=A0A498I3S6_MALDO|nr:hypothetical protein DVH24_039811 [Malus domestica]
MRTRIKKPDLPQAFVRTTTYAAVSPEKMTEFLDLDESLAHAQADPPPKKFDFIVQLRINGIEWPFDPYSSVCSSGFKIAIFSAEISFWCSCIPPI